MEAMKGNPNTRYESFLIELSSFGKPAKNIREPTAGTTIEPSKSIVLRFISKSLLKYTKGVDNETQCTKHKP